MVKYSIYVLILYNVFYFAFEDFMSAEHRYRGGVDWSQFTDAFAQAVDSFAWLILLIMLELETWIIDDHKHRGALKWSVNAVSFICYIFIFLAFLGYYEKLDFVLNFQSVDVQSACNAVGSYLSYTIDIDEFAALSAQNCMNVGAAPYYANEIADIIASNKAYSDMYLLGYTEVINAGVWLLIVVLLWVDVYLQMHRQKADQYHLISKWIKVGLYSILIVAAIIWGFYGKFIDFWDAFLWIVAFFFIELNIFQWNEEIITDDIAAAKLSSQEHVS